MNCKQNQHAEEFTTHILSWEVRMRGGAYEGRPYSKETIRTYKRIATSFIQRFPEASMASIETFLYEIPPEKFSSREKAHRALVSFMKHLGKDDAFMEALGKLRPKRHQPPKRQCVNAKDLQNMTQACRTIRESAILVVASETGLRVSEMASLKWKDVDFTEGVIWIRQGKWMTEPRRVGMTPNVRRHLMMLTGKMGPVFGVESRWGIYRIIKEIGERANVEATPHSLRRAFVTINHSKGRPLKALQIICGHKDLSTTESYCRTTEQEAIDMMKNWA